MDSPAGRPQSPRPTMGPIPGGRSLAWIVGLFFSVIASIVAIVLAVALAASVVVVAVMGGVLLGFASLAARARRTVKARNDGPPILEARNVGGHSWVAYGWDRRQ
jgi:cobalamin biosynthesis protein CobD/CbiB